MVLFIILIIKDKSSLCNVTNINIITITKYCIGMNCATPQQCSYNVVLLCLHTVKLFPPTASLSKQKVYTSSLSRSVMTLARLCITTDTLPCLKVTHNSCSEPSFHQSGTGCDISHFRGD